MPIGGPFDGAKGVFAAHPTRWEPPWGPAGNARGGASSPGTVFGRINGLIVEAQQQMRTFAEERTVYFAYTEQLRTRIQQCLLDAGEKVLGELQEINAIDFSPSTALQGYYSKKVFNDFEAPGDPIFPRLQKEYDAQTQPKIQRMLELLTRARGKLIAPNAPAPQLSQAASQAEGTEPGSPRKPYSRRDHALYEMIGPDDLALFTDAELWKRKAKDFRKMQPPGRQATLNAFRARLFRIRRYHGLPTPKL